MKKKIIALLSMALMAMVSVNVTSCSDDDDDDDKTEAKDAASQGKTDGEEFASLYTAAKEAGWSSTTGVANITKMITSASKYRNSEDKAYKAAYLASASGATNLAEDKVESLLGANSVEAITTIINALSGSN